MTPARQPKPRAAGPRPGTTLTEVLMALLVMGLGLVSVATLFPLSLLRSVEATKLTNATLLRINAEARIKASVGTDDFGNAIRRAIVEDPNNDGEVREHDATKFVFDPLGANILAGDGATYADGSSRAIYFGGQDANSDGRLEAPVGIGRYNFGMTSLAAAEAFVSLPDSFVSLADMLGGAVTLTPTQLDINVDGPSLSEYVGQDVRVTAINAGAPGSVVFAGSITSASRVALSGGTVPAGFEVGRVTIEAPERRYSWIATVRRFGLKPSVTIAVFFRRSFDPEDERIYSANEPAGSYNEFELPTTVDPASPIGALLRPPGMRVGGYMFDVNSFRWLKITSIDDVKTGAGSPFLRFTTDPEDVDLSIQPRSSFPAMFPSNVVEAYTLKKN